MTMYRGSARVLDTVINGTISYEPPIIRVEKVSFSLGRLEKTRPETIKIIKSQFQYKLEKASNSDDYKRPGQ